LGDDYLTFSIPQVRLTVPAAAQKTIRSRLKKEGVESPTWENLAEEDAATAVLTLAPGSYRAVDDIVRDETKGSGKLEVMELKEVAGGDDM
jgi:ribosome maturation protein SDO1